jgi:pSer/pThr/pTyr-binding forkhead associated (FHA) protein
MAKPVRCTHCGRDNDASFTFCADCGKSLKPEAPKPPVAAATVAGEKFCASCGAKLMPGFKFCAQCGKGAETPATAPATPAAPRAPWAPRLVMLRPDGQVGEGFTLAKADSVCGRERADILLSSDPGVSPQHARFLVRGEHLYVEDLSSLNGTFIRVRSPQPIANGDDIRLGHQLLRLETPTLPEGGEARPWGSPLHLHDFLLTQHLEGGGVGETFPLRAGENVLGREVGDITFPDDGYVSGRHARVDVTGQSAVITDLGSSNGTFVRASSATEIAPGDQVLIGSQVLRVEMA